MKGEQMIITVKYHLTEENYDILKEYGYDFEKNAQCQANEAAKALRWCSENQDVDNELNKE